MSLPADQGTEAGAGTAIAVTGVGLVTPAGADEHSFWERLCSGHSTARRCEELAGLPVDFACPVDDKDQEAPVGGRCGWPSAPVGNRAR
ncbi:beta-ketoacyl synthase N-terminal-like domain-containing protein, partial [Streptomyces anulatus]